MDRLIKQVKTKPIKQNRRLNGQFYRQVQIQDELAQDSTETKINANKAQKLRNVKNLKRASVDYNKSLIKVDHFHKFCRNYLILHDKYFHRAEDDDWLEVGLPNLVSSLRKKENDVEFDVILIDEGQDFRENWFNTLQAFASDNNEMMIVQDEKQNVYKRDTKWIRKTKKNPYIYRKHGYWAPRRSGRSQ